MTLHYPFPVFSNYSEIQEIFQDNPNFSVVNKGEYSVINYIRMGKETHPEIIPDSGNNWEMAVLREARGLIFNSKNGALISRPFHKFFNYGEREDLVPDFSMKHWFVEKLDGSMIRPLFLESGIRLGTKMGITDVSIQAEEFIKNRPEYMKIIYDCNKYNMTPIFEWCSRKQRIVIDYPEDKLVLTAIRNNLTGLYTPRRLLEMYNRDYGIPIPKIYNFGPDFIEVIRNFEDEEGVIIEFEDGHRLKIKADAYVNLHRAKSLLENERDVIGLILNEKTDDLLPLLSLEDRNNLLNFESSLWSDIENFTRMVNSELININTNNISRKDFALTRTDLSGNIRSMIFSKWGSNCDLSDVVAVILRHLGSRSQYEKIQGIIPNSKWREIKLDE